MSLAAQRCLLHSAREAAARCATCRNFFCRECATEHEGRILCASCLAKAAKPKSERRRASQVAAAIAFPIAGIVTLCFFFYLFGRLILALVEPGS